MAANQDGYTNTSFVNGDVQTEMNGHVINDHYEEATHLTKTPKRSKKFCKSSFTGCEITLLVMGSLALVFGLIMVSGGYQAMFDAILKSQLEISPGSRSYEMWKLTPVPLYLRVYFFNLTNPMAFKLGGKPNLEEVGPYCYREYHEKKNLTFHANSTISFFQERWWVWDEENSIKFGNHSKDDIIVTLNTIPVSAAWSVRNIAIARANLSGMLDELGEELVIKATASEIMFDGVQDPILDWMTEYLGENSTFHWIVDYLPPGLTAYDKFGWFYGRNNSLYYDGFFNMYTGQDTLDNIGKIDLWNQSTTTDFFDAPCNKVRGSAGEMWPPNRDKTYIDFYSSDMCMSMKLFYKEDAKESHGLEGYRYWGSKDTFANGSTVQGNECFCAKETCAPYGLINAESCRMGSPAFISFPHFFNADPYLAKMVTGMEPDETKHAFNMDLIPELGTPMNVEARMQINLFVRPYKDIKMLKNLRELYFPLMWFEEVAGIPDDMASQLLVLTYMMRSNIMIKIFWVIAVLGFLTIVIVLLRHYYKKLNETLRKMEVETRPFINTKL